MEEANRLGHLLYAYDQAAWHGTDAVMPLFDPDPEALQERVAGYVVESIPEGWRVGFGRLSPDSSAFLAAYESVLDTSYAVISAQEYGQRCPPQRILPRCHARPRCRHGTRFTTRRAEVQHNTAVLPCP